MPRRTGIVAPSIWISCNEGQETNLLVRAEFHPCVATHPWTREVTNTNRSNWKRDDMATKYRYGLRAMSRVAVSWLLLLLPCDCHYSWWGRHHCLHRLVPFPWSNTSSVWVMWLPILRLLSLFSWYQCGSRSRPTKGSAMSDFVLGTEHALLERSVWSFLGVAITGPTTMMLMLVSTSGTFSNKSSGVFRLSRDELL